VRSVAGLLIAKFLISKCSGLEANDMDQSFDDEKRVSTFLSTPQIAALKDQLSRDGCVVHESGSREYIQATRLRNGAVKRKPALVVACRNANDVRAAVLAARAAGLPVSVRNGGQDWVGRGLRDGGLVLDLTSMRKCSVDLDALEVTISGGVTVGDLNAAASRHGLAAIIGNDSALSMAGLVLGGGYGPLMTRFGLVADNLISAEVVLADGNFVACDAARQPDLFWAIRGGGGNFGVVTSMRLRLHQAGKVLSGSIVFPWGDAPAVLKRFSELMRTAPDELGGAAIISVGPGGNPVIVISPAWSGDPESGRQIEEEIQSFGKPIVSKVEAMAATDLLTLTDGKLVPGRGYQVATRWLSDLSSDIVSALIGAYDERTSTCSSIIVHHFHGAGTRIRPGDTAFGMRQPHFTTLIYGAWEPAHEDGTDHGRWARDLSSKLSDYALPGGYANLLGDDALDQVGSAFGPNRQRLLDLKARFDPGHIFSATPLPVR
jgi:FAD/FMN-containing dehydrogenase